MSAQCQELVLQFSAILLADIGVAEEYQTNKYTNKNIYLRFGIKHNALSEMA